MRCKCLVDGELSQGRKGGDFPYLRYILRIPLLPQYIHTYIFGYPMVQKDVNLYNGGIFL